MLGLSSWLRDSDVPAPDARMSASRVMAGVDTTKRLGRFWPPARLVGAVEPAAELGTFGPAGPTGHSEQHVPSPALGARVRELVTPVRALAAAVVVALIGTVVLLGSSFPSSSPTPEPAAAAVAPVVEKSPLPAVVVVPPPTATPRPAPTPRPEPSATPEPVVAAWEPSDRTFDWLDGGVRMEANALRLNIAGKSLSAVPGEVYTAGSTEPAQAQLEVHWYDGRTGQQLLLELAADDDEWWVRRVRTLDGRKNPSWVMFDVPAARTRTAFGESWEGDLKLKSTGAQRKALREPGSATLRLNGLRVTAFREVAPVAETAESIDEVPGVLVDELVDEAVDEPAPGVASQP